MGFFSTTKTYVASTLYNLAGPEEDRPDYLKTLVVGNVISNSKFSISDTLRSGYTYGPGMKLRTYFRWALDNYDTVGVPRGSLGGSGSIDPAVVQGEIQPVDPANTIAVESVSYGTADYSVWAEQWMLANHPELIDTAWTSDIDSAGVVTVTFADTTQETFTPIGFNSDKVYIYALYTESTPEVPGPVVQTRKVFIYEMGTGNAVLDGLLSDTVDDGEYMPFIPLRLDNQFLSETFEPEAYAVAKKAFRKSVGGKMDKVIEGLADNEELDEIDYAYVMFGVPLNVKDRASREYLYRFFDKLRQQRSNANAEYLIWLNNGAVGFPPVNSVWIKGTGTLSTNVDMKVTWSSITEETGEGLQWGTKAGSIDVVYTGADTFEIRWQVTGNSWKKLTVIKAVHDNLIYKNKSVTITAEEALLDADPSGFLVPIHYGTSREMTLVNSTQMMTACAYVVLNSYKVVKKKWYQTGLFKVITFVVLIAITIAIPPLGGSAIAAYATIGAMVGLTGILAVIAGAVITSLISMIVMRILQEVGTAVFGEKFGMIFAAVSSFVLTTVGASMLNGASLSAAWGNMMSASNLIQLTNATVNGISGYVQASAQGIIAKTSEMMEDYERESREISQLFAENIGYGRGVIDPMSLTDASVGNFLETESQFLSRTLMTGSDIAELSLDMLTNFSEYTLSTDLALNG